MWRNVVGPDRPQWATKYGGCWIPQATHTHVQYVILTAFPLEQWLHERASMLRYTSVFSICRLCFLLVRNRSKEAKQTDKTNNYLFSRSTEVTIKPSHYIPSSASWFQLIYPYRCPSWLHLPMDKSFCWEADSCAVSTAISHNPRNPNILRMSQCSKAVSDRQIRRCVLQPLFWVKRKK
jgi:hypothetical protein